jgi:hypothetical protein
MNSKAPIGSLNGSLTTNDTDRIKKLLTYANCSPTINEATAAGVVAYRPISDGIKRGVVDFTEIEGFLPWDLFEYDRRRRRRPQ